MKVQINLSDKIRRSAIAQGRELPTSITIVVNPAALPEDLRAQVAPILPLVEPGQCAPRHRNFSPSEEGILEDWAQPGMWKNPWQCSVDPSLGAEAVLRAWIADRSAKEQAYTTEKSRQAAFVAEAKAWAEKHGSNRLRKGLAQDYDMTRLYVTERAAADHEGFVVDWKDACEWDRRSSPSERALDVAAEHDGEVVWLETLPDGAETAEEAVVIREYLGRYDLVMPMGDPEEA